MPATIRDVARRSGVHISTVSRTFSAPHLVNEDTRDRVLATARELGYRPNRSARALITGRTFNIGLVVADIANPFFPPLIKAAEGQARQRDYHTVIADTNEDAAGEPELIRALAERVDGIILCSPRTSNRTIAEIGGDIPLVVVNRLVDGLPCVVMEVAQGARQAIEHLVGLGHRRLAYVAGPRGSWTSRQIRGAAGDAARRAGATLALLGPNPPTRAGGQAAADLLAADTTAVLAYNDLMAVGLIEGLEATGRQVPAEVSVIGIDDTELSRLIRPRLTTITNPTTAAGRAAVDMLLSYDRDDVAGGRLTLPTELIVRDSTGPTPEASPSSATGGDSG